MDEYRPIDLVVAAILMVALLRGLFLGLIREADPVESTKEEAAARRRRTSLCAGPRPGEGATWFVDAPSALPNVVVRLLATPSDPGEAENNSSSLQFENDRSLAVMQRPSVRARLLATDGADGQGPAAHGRSASFKSPMPLSSPASYASLEVPGLTFLQSQSE